MTAWTAGPRAVSVTIGGQVELIACAPSGMAGTKEWADRAALMAMAPELRDALQSPLDMDLAYKRGPTVVEAVERARAAIAAAGQP